MQSRAGPSAVVMLRHAQSRYNLEGRFTGWDDPGLTEVGRAEARVAAARLAASGWQPDLVFTSCLRRARETTDIVLSSEVPVIADWRLNERHYGALQGESKADVAERVGASRVWRWRRGYLERPPPLGADDPRHPVHDPRYAGVDRARLPDGESLADTRERVMELWRDQVAPAVRDGRRVLVSSHGNTLRALLMALDGMGVAEVEDLEIPTGVPMVYRFREGVQPIGWHYLGAGPRGRGSARVPTPDDIHAMAA